MKNNAVILKAGKDKAIRNHHHWVFSGAIQRYPDSYQEGEIAPVQAANGELLGFGYFNRKTSLAGRMVSFDDKPPLETIQIHLKQAIFFRKELFDLKETNAFRLINGEGDLLPGLVVDSYNGTLVIQISTLGMDKLRPWIIEQLTHLCSPKGIYEKSVLPSRAQEGLKSIQGCCYGTVSDEVEILENGLRFIVKIAEGQKTGFFLDHREMRSYVRRLAKDRRVLNCFSYTGAFSVYAAAGKAKSVTSVDISDTATALAEKNMALNAFPTQAQIDFVTADVFQFLREKELSYDLVILDPPAFAKKQQEVTAACRGYKDINRLAMQKMPKNSLLLTCSCSYHVDKTLFQQVLFQAAREANRTVQIIGTHHMAPDHPINICHPESDYLKSCLLYIH